MKNHFEWSDEYALQIEEIDKQHKELISLTNSLYIAIQNCSAEDELDEIVTRLLSYADYHFDTEERYFKEFAYEDTEVHIKEHSTFREKLDSLKEQDMKNVSTAFELLDFLEDWLISHVKNIDRKYVTCFKEHGL